MPAAPKPHARLAPLLLLVLTLVWGTNWPLFSMALREISVWTFRAFTLSVGGLLMLLVARQRGLSLHVPRQYWPVMGLTAWSYLAFWNVAATQAALLIPSGQAALLGFTMPLWAAIISRLFFGAGFDRRQLLALMLGIAGVITLMIPSFAAYADAPLGMALGLMSGIGWALGTVVLKFRPVPVHVMVLTGWQLLIASVPVLIIAWHKGDHQWFIPGTSSLLIIAYITIIPGVGGNLLWFTLVRWLPAPLLSLAPIMVPVVAMISGAIVLHEPLGPIQWLAMILCSSALGLMLFRRS